MQVTLIELKRLYNSRKDEDTTLELKGLKFFPGYLKYLIEYLQICKATDGDIITLEPKGNIVDTEA